MTDIRIRKNEKCVIGLPSCDYVFSSTRSCFIAYGFSTSNLEKDVIVGVLRDNGIEAVEAGDRTAPGTYAFCTKICSKIITAQFCIVLLNRDAGGPNANVNIEYGMMIGFNKYVIPFQKDTEELPFNVSALDTVKYNQNNLKSKATDLIKIAIEKTAQGQENEDINQALSLFLLVMGATVVNLSESPDAVQMYRLGAHFGFNLVERFDGMSYIYFGNFSTLPAKAIIWRLEKLCQIFIARLGSLTKRIEFGAANPQALPAFKHILETLQVWLIVQSDIEEREIRSWVLNGGASLPLEIFTWNSVVDAVSGLQR